MTHTSCPSSLTVKAGLSFQGTLPLVDTGRDHERPWSTDLENTVFQPSIQIDVHVAGVRHDLDDGIGLPR